MLVSLLLLLPKPGSAVRESGGISPSGRMGSIGIYELSSPLVVELSISLGSDGGISGSGFVAGGNTSGFGDKG
jgi:hypothetical protein